MSKIICICGAPRSRTTFLMDCLLAHPFLKGAIRGEFRTNEAANLMYAAIAANNYTGLIRLYEHWVTGDHENLVVKAPGYLFAEKYFLNNPMGVDVVFLVTERNPVSIISSALNYPDAITHVSRPLNETDCPIQERDRFAALWPTATPAERSAMRTLWHIDAEPPAKAFSVTAQTYYYPSAFMRRICSICGVPMHAAVTEKAKEFRETPISDARVLELSVMLENVRNNLAR